MDILILSCGTGGGHDAAGKAVAEEAIRRGHRCTILNPYRLHSNKLAERINSIYISTVTFTPPVFGAIYVIGQLYRRLPWRSPVYFANRAMVPRLKAYLESNHYDVIICTHLFPSEILANMKAQGIAIPKSIFIATDYTCIPFTEESDCDAYVIPAKELTDEFAGRGIPAERIYPLGIPVRKQFTDTDGEPVSLERLGLEKGKKYILVSGGSIGAGGVKRAVQALCKKATLGGIGLIVFCGNNKRLYKQLQKAHLENAVVLDYTDNAADYIRASEVYLTKPGGLSSTEAAVCGIPLVHIAPIPGCETYNAKFFENKGMSFNCGRSWRQLMKALQALKDASLCNKMVAEQHKCISSDASAKICDLAEQMAQHDAE